MSSEQKAESREQRAVKFIEQNRGEIQREESREKRNSESRTEIQKRRLNSHEESKVIFGSASESSSWISPME